MFALIYFKNNFNYISISVWNSIQRCLSHVVAASIPKSVVLFCVSFQSLVTAQYLLILTWDIIIVQKRCHPMVCLKLFEAERTWYEYFFLFIDDQILDGTIIIWRIIGVLIILTLILGIAMVRNYIYLTLYKWSLFD